MADLDDLEARLESHARAFQSLLALTPARDYYGPAITGEDPSEQWSKKKQTKEQKRAAKKAKLDPANQKSALDIMKENEEKERKRKRDDDGVDESGEVSEPEPSTEKVTKGSKRQKVEKPDDEEVAAKKRIKTERKKEKRKLKEEKTAKKKAKAEARKAAKQNEDLAEAAPKKQNADVEEDVDDQEDAEPMSHPTDLEMADFSGLVASKEEAPASEASSAPTSPAPDSPAFDIATNHSATSSSSSIIPPSTIEELAKSSDTTAKPALTTNPGSSSKPSTDSGVSSPKLQLPKIDQAELKERLQKRLAELRAKRKADGPDGKPARNRSELLEQRRTEAERKKKAKQEQRRKQKEEEQRAAEARLRGSGSPLSADIFSPRSPTTENNFSFSRLAFEDGATADGSSKGIADARKKKGPQDPKTALLAAEKKASRLAGYDETKKADIAEKDMWLDAKKRAHGERIRDDQSLLKKALKRKEKGKAKSEKEWKEREESVKKGREMKQKKREANLQKRKDEKGAKGKKKPQGGKPKGKKGRPGFEGRFKA